MIQNKIAVFFPKDSEAMFNRNSTRTFGGSTIHLYQFVMELYNSACVYTLLPNYSTIDFDDYDKFHVIKLYSENDWNPVKLIKFMRFCRSNQIDTVLQLGLTIQSCIMAVLCRLINIKFVFLFAHDVESMSLYQNSRKKCHLFPVLIKYSSLLIAQNEIEKENLLKRYPALTKIRVLKKGINFEKINPSPAEKKFDAISIARCEEWKNIEAYLEIVSLNKSSKFLLISPPVPGKESYFNKIKDLANEMQNLTFFSFVPYNEIYRLLSESKVIFVTSDMEGDWPLTVIEATATGLPVFSLNYSYGTLIEKYNAGYYCEGSIQKMNHLFQKLLSDNSLLENMSKQAYKYANENHNSKKNVQLLIDWINSD